jgi:hypothetical protein
MKSSGALVSRGKNSKKKKLLPLIGYRRIQEIDQTRFLYFRLFLEKYFHRKPSFIYLAYSV